MKVRDPDEQTQREIEDPEGLPPMDFSQMILSFGTSALVHLGALEHPDTRKVDRDLSAARQTIEMLAMLEDKTQGNLSAQEEGLLRKLLLDLRLAYTKASAE